MQKSEGILEELPGRIPKIIYFQTAGRAQPIRLTFVVGGIRFVDVRMAREKVEDLKRRDVLPFGTLPVMELGDQVFSDSNAILRLAGRMTGLYPEKVVPSVRCDEILGVKEDIIHSCHPWIYAKPEDKPTVRNELVATTIPCYMSYLERRLERNPSSPFFVGDELTVADMAIFGTMSWILTVLEYVQALDRFPRLQHLMNKIGSMPVVREYLEEGKGAETQNIEKDQATPEMRSEVQSRSE